MEALPQLEASPPMNELSPSRRSSQITRYALSTSDLLERESSSSSTPLWDTRFERERGSCSGLLESTPREAEATPNPLAMMLRDGLTVVVNEAPSPDMEKDVEK